MKIDEGFCDCEFIHEEVVNVVKKGLPNQEELQQLSYFFKLFGDHTRVRILGALDQHEMCVCDLAALLSMTKSAISHQLRALREANLVKNRREGKVVYYSLADDHVKTIVEVGLEHIREKQEED